VERYKSLYEQHMRRIDNVQDFVAALQAVLTMKNSVRQIAHQTEVAWFFAPYSAADIPRVSRKACCIPRIQSTYCLSRDRQQRRDQLWNRIFSDNLDAENENLRVSVTIVWKATRKLLRKNPGVKASQSSNLARLQRKREFQEKMLAGSPILPGDAAEETSDSSLESD
jgi:hypothetical protein